MYSDESWKRDRVWNHVVIMISSKNNRTPPFESRSYVWKSKSKIAYTTYIPCAKLRKFPHWRIWIEHNYHIIMLHSMIVITWQTLNWNHYSITCWEISLYELPSTQQHASYRCVWTMCKWMNITINKNKPKSALMENLS